MDEEKCMKSSIVKLPSINNDEARKLENVSMNFNTNAIDDIKFNNFIGHVNDLGSGSLLRTSKLSKLSIQENFKLYKYDKNGNVVENNKLDNYQKKGGYLSQHAVVDQDSLRTKILLSNTKHIIQALLCLLNYKIPQIKTWKQCRTCLSQTGSDNIRRRIANILDTSEEIEIGYYQSQYIKKRINMVENSKCSNDTYTICTWCKSLLAICSSKPYTEPRKKSKNPFKRKKPKMFPGSAIESEYADEKEIVCSNFDAVKNTITLDLENACDADVEDNIEIVTCQTKKKKNIKINGYKVPCIIRYTLDGTEPTCKSNIYTKALSIVPKDDGLNKHVLLKAKSFLVIPNTGETPDVSIFSLTSTASYVISGSSSKREKKKKDVIKRLPATEIGTVPEVVVNGILRVINQHIVDIKECVPAIKNVMSNKIFTAVNKTVQHNDADEKFVNQIKPSPTLKIISVEKSNKKKESKNNRNSGIKSHQPHSSVDINYCVEIATKKNKNLNQGCFKKNRNNDATGTVTLAQAATKPQSGGNNKLLSSSTEIVIDTLQSLSMIETISKNIGKKLGKKLYKNDVKMCNVSQQNVEKVKLEISWGFPRPRSVDFLDGSCLVYSGVKLLEVVDFRGAHSKLQDYACSSSSDSNSSDDASENTLNSSSDSSSDDQHNNLNRDNHERRIEWRRQRIRRHTKKYKYSCRFWRKLFSDDGTEEAAADSVHHSIKHSGDLIYMKSNSGQHIIDINLNTLPLLVTDIVFALSAFSCGVLNEFKKPKIRLLNALNPLHELCPRYSIANCKNEAIIMCSIRKGRNGQWTVVTGGNNDATGKGTIRDYRPIDQLTFPTLIYHNRWARRKQIILLYTLVKYGRAELPLVQKVKLKSNRLPRHKQDTLHTLFQYYLSLPCELAIKVIMYL
eukprot:g3077.t1